APTTGDATFGQSTPEASTMPSGLAAGFAMLRRAQSASDMPAAFLLQAVQPTPTSGVGSRFGVNPALTRLAGKPGGAPVWLVPGSSGACLLDASGGGGCGPTAGSKGIARQGIYLVRVPVNGDPPTARGILPDGATVQAVDSTGSPIAGVQESGQAYALPPGTASFTIHFKDGSTINEPMPASGAPPPGP
ncbi:MAG TPA: hypothetical protein VFR49_01815, partial [Solirubrobacteraceae bacterium]|nr:hypothetical protein [Solirubrobacteraceae bacterium]